MQDDFHHLAQRLINDFGHPKLKKHRAEHKRIKKYYSPRERFNRWRDSEKGKAWKAEQYKSIKGKCPGECDRWLPIDIFEIDHVEPISKFPELATTLGNLRLLCPPCNKRKSSICE
jgi:5-methylcytosine-specific restriction endonuclease McrA